MGSLAALVFIAAAAGGGIFLATQKTVIKGEVMAETMLEKVKEKGISKIVCDDEIPVSPKGASFECKFEGTDGSTARFQYVMARNGSLASSLLGSTGPTKEAPERPRPAPGTDSWGD